MNVTDPDGGIHSTGKNNSKVLAMEVMTRLSEWPKEGWTLSLEKAPEFSTLFYIFVSVWREKQRGKKTRGVLKETRRARFV